MIRQSGVQEPCCSIGGCLACGVAQDKEQSLRVTRLHHRRQVEQLPVQRKFGHSRCGQVERSAQAVGNLLGARRIEGNPARGNPEMRVGRIPVQAAKSGTRRRIGVLDAQGKTVAARQNGQR